MSVWPVPDSYSKTIPHKGEPGCFWEDRDEKYHCGIDIHAPLGSIVLAIESGIVIETGSYTTAEDEDYFLDTYYVIVKTPHKIFFKYSELSEFTHKVGDRLKAGDEIGKIGTPLDIDKVPMDLPFYMKEMINNDRTSMLHIELLKVPVIEIKPYSYGNFLGKTKPYSLLDPALFLNGNSR